MTKERKDLLALATTVGLALDVDFQPNISSKNLQKLIDEKKQSTADAMQKQPGNKEENQNENTTPEQENKTPLAEKQPGDDDDYVLNEMPIKRTSPCGNYRTQIIGAKEAARRSGLEADEVKESLENGKPVKGWKFEEVE